MNIRENESSDDDDDCCAFVVESYAMIIKGESNTWYADTGASEHMTDRLEWFINIVDIHEGRHLVMVADDRSLPIREKGDIYIKRTVNGKEKAGILKGVLYIPDLKRNLFSIRQATKTDLAFINTKNKCELRTNEGTGKVMMEGYRTGKLYSLQIKITLPETQESQANIVHKNVKKIPKLSIQTWYKRMAHVNKDTIRKMHTNGCLDHFDIAQDEKKTKQSCPSCMFGKQHKSSYPVNPEKIRSQILGEFIHGDVVGSMKQSSIGGARYFLLFKDDCTRYRYVYFLKRKSEVFKSFQHVVLSLQRNTGQTLKKFRSDRGGEFCSKEFDQFLLERGIKRETSVPYTSEQNGYIERDNRTVTDAAWSMIHAQGLPLTFGQRRFIG